MTWAFWGAYIGVSLIVGAVSAMEVSVDHERGVDVTHPYYRNRSAAWLALTCWAWPVWIIWRLAKTARLLVRTVRGGMKK